jgi:hypothetical protein
MGPLHPLVTPRPSRRRGFALLIVMVLAVAMVAVASALTLSSGYQAIAASHDEGAELARVIAESGLARADAWAIQTLKSNGGVDFDKVLDPSLDADCSGLDSGTFNLSTTGSSPKAGATTFLPTFTEAGASVVEFPAGSGRKWRRIALNQGAYLVRYEDNADDGITPAGDWSTRTGNNAGTSNCVEGPTQGENPARDRDGAIWAQVIGVYPGTNPSTAVHRVLLRKLIRLPSGAPGQPAFSVGGNVDANVSASNNVASLVVGGNVTSSAGFCGRVSAGGSSTATANSACSPTPNPFLNDPGAAVTPTSVAAPEAGVWYDWTTPCNFYVKPGVGFFYWDAAATRGGASCASYSGGIVAPNPDASEEPENGSCWTPIILRSDPMSASSSSPGNVAVAYEPFENSGRDNVRHTDRAPACAAFKPSTSSGTYADPGGGYTTANFTSGTSSISVSFKSWFTSPTTVTIPNFASCSVAGSASELKWPSSTITSTTPAVATQPSTFSRMNCTACNGSTPAIAICPDPAAPDETIQFLDAAAAYVTGVIYKEGNYVQGPGFSTTPEPTSVNGARSSWPMFTFLVQGDFVLNVNDKLWIGIGTKKGNFPSLVVGGNVDASAASGGAKLKTLGGLYVRGNVSMKKSLVMYGPVAIGGNIEALSGGSAVWDYDYDFFGNGAPTSSAPEPIVTFPVSF